LRCVPAEINQVLLNLVVNAADAVADKVGSSGETKGVITIRTRASNSSAIIEVQDTGCGIPPEFRDRIFDPFFTTKEVGKGTGQGLTICFNIVVTKHQGSIEVVSEPGVGTTFRVLLPITNRSSTEPIAIDRDPIDNIAPSTDVNSELPHPTPGD
jgi:signal transduction histidine kinase